MKAMLFLVVGALLCFSSCRRPQDIENAEPFARISAEQLFREYKTDRKAAAEKYQGKILEVTGVAERVGADSAGSPFVNLRGEPASGGVQVFFSKGQGDRASKVQPGQTITVKGKSTVFVINALLEESVIVR